MARTCKKYSNGMPRGGVKGMTVDTSSEATGHTKKNYSKVGGRKR